jgi:hypothetical protein
LLEIIEFVLIRLYCESNSFKELREIFQKEVKLTLQDEIEKEIKEINHKK